MKHLNKQRKIKFLENEKKRRQKEYKRLQGRGKKVSATHKIKKIGKEINDLRKS